MRDGLFWELIMPEEELGFTPPVPRRSRQGRLQRDRLGVFGADRLPTGAEMGTILLEAACWATIDGRPAAGQFETHRRRSYIEHLAAAGVA